MKRRAWVCFEAARRFLSAGFSQRELVLLLLLSGMLAVFGGAATASDSLYLLLDRADAVASDATEPPPDSAAWQPTRLPEEWERPDAAGYGWYRLSFELRELPAGRVAVYSARVRNVAEVFVNGKPVGRTGEFGHIDPRPASQMFEFDTSLLRAGANVIHVRAWSTAQYHKWLAPVHVGNLAALERERERERFLSGTLSDIAGVFSVTVGLYMLLIWMQRRRDEMYGYFGAGALCDAVWISYYRGMLPWDALGPYLQNMVQLFGNATSVLLFIYCLRFAGWRWPRVERAAWLCAVLAWFIEDVAWPAAAAAHPGLAVPTVIDLSAILALTYATLLLMAYIAVKQPSGEAVLLLLGHLYSSVTLSVWGFDRPLEGIDHGPTHLIPLFVIMGWILTRRFVRSLNETDALNAGLEQRVAERHAELEREQAKLQALTRQQAIGEERERIIADMHDGLGAQLITTLGEVEQGAIAAPQVADALRECIDDLRLAIDSLQPADDDLLAVLGNLRYRLESRLKAQGIALDWDVRDVPKLACLTPHNVLHLLRLLQEAFANVVKHAQATRIRVATAVDAQRVKIDVADNGRGFDVDSVERGEARGLAKMRRRATTIGGELLVMPTPAGTTLSLLLPRG
jgi:signal transduction histidine kinase